MANFAILRVAKIKTMGALSASAQHNFRERETKNADPARTLLNVIEGAKNAQELVQKTSDLLPIKRRKDAVIGLEYLITASPEHFGEDWEKRQDWGQAYFKDAIAWLEKRHGAANIVCKTVHLDESTPHLAVFVVPNTKDGRLSAKDFVGGRAILSKMQTSFANEVGLKHGLVRGVERSNAVHQDNAKIAPMTAERLALRKRVKELEAEIDRLAKSAGAGGAVLAAAKKALEQAQGDLAKAQERITHQQALNVANMHLINKIEAEKKMMEKALVTAKEQDHELVAEIAALRAVNEDAQASMEKENETLKQELSKAPYLHAMITGRIGNTLYMLTPASEIFASEEAYLEFVNQAAKENQDELEGAERAQEAFSEKWAGIKTASVADIAVGRVVDVCGRQAVYNLGRGVHAIHTIEQGKPLPALHTEQAKDGVGR
jgi:hypothetical protein